MDAVTDFVFNERMNKRLAATISGAVSLGSYEAGVMYEIITALGQHNQNPATTPEERIELDVLTGASAGGMTAAIAAQKLLFDSGSFVSEYANPFYFPWVEEIDLTGLLRFYGTDDPAKSILSSQLVEDISKRYLTARYQSANPTPARKHPAANNALKLGLAMSNLNGVNYSTTAPPGRPESATFAYTRFQDEFKRPLNGTSTLGDTIEVWEPIRQAAVACGAFPFAFRIQELQRLAQEFASNATFPNPALKFAYTDGGVFQNEPLGLAKDLVDEIDQHQAADSRFYLYVSPHAKAPVADSSFSAETAKLWPTALCLINAVYHEAQYQDWLRAEKVNEQIYRFNDYARGLQQALLNRKVVAAQLEPASRGLLPLLFPNDASDAAKNRERDRLKRQFQPEYDALRQAFPDSTPDVWIDSILVLETSAGLGPKDEMNIYTITAADDQIAGELLYSFGGFFAQEFRRYDYDRGRINARMFLREHAHVASGPNEIGPIRFSDGPDPVLEPGMGRKQVTDLSREMRQKLRDQIASRLDDVMKAAGISLVVRWGIRAFYLSPKLDEWFKL